MKLPGIFFMQVHTCTTGCPLFHVALITNSRGCGCTAHASLFRDPCTHTSANTIWSTMVEPRWTIRSTIQKSKRPYKERSAIWFTMIDLRWSAMIDPHDRSAMIESRSKKSGPGSKEGVDPKCHFCPQYPSIKRLHNFALVDGVGVKRMNPTLVEPRLDVWVTKGSLERCLYYTCKVTFWNESLSLQTTVPEPLCWSVTSEI